MLNEAKDEQQVSTKLTYKAIKTKCKFNPKLTLPYLMPDEFLAGYAGRICKLNDFNELEALRTFYFKKHLEQNPDHSKQQLLLYLAAELELTEEYLFRNHTVLSFLQSGNQKAALAYHIRSCILKADQSPHGFCEQCVNEDLSYHGFSYWRTQHQIHGVDYCYKHEKQMIKYSMHNDSLRYSPYWNLKSNNYQTTSIELDSHKNEFVLRYQKLVKEYIAMGITIPTVKVATHLRNYVKSQKCKPNKYFEIEFPSKYIVDNFPKSWLKTHFPIFFKHKIGKVPGFDNFFDLSSASSSQVVALLMMATLQDSSDLWSYKTHFKTQHQIRTISRENDNQLLKSYISNDKSIVKTAKALNLEYDGLRKRLKKIKNRIGVVNMNSELTDKLLTQVPNRGYTKRHKSSKLNVKIKQHK